MTVFCSQDEKAHIPNSSRNCVMLNSCRRTLNLHSRIADLEHQKANIEGEIALLRKQLLSEEKSGTGGVEIQLDAMQDGVTSGNICRSCMDH